MREERSSQMNQWTSGIFLHTTSLSNTYPTGDLGSATNAFVDFMVETRLDSRQSENALMTTMAFANIEPVHN